MPRSLIAVLFIAFSITLCSCQKEPGFDDPGQPPTTKREFSKLKSIAYRYRTYEDSTCYRYDTANNKIRLIQYYLPVPGDSVVYTYSYNDNNQLITYEYQVSDNSVFAQPYFADVIKMQFVRNGSGQLEKVLSTYRDARIQQSEGIVRYGKNGDTTFITFIDSAQKNIDPTYYDLMDHYKVAIKNKLVVAVDFLPVSTYPFYEERDVLQYNASGALTANKAIQPSGGEFITSYERGTKSATELQKFSARLAGDLHWFFRTKAFNFDYLVGDSYFLFGPCPTRIKEGPSYENNFINEYNAQGQLIKVTRRDPSDPSEDRVENIQYYP